MLTERGPKNNRKSPRFLELLGKVCERFGLFFGNGIAAIIDKDCYRLPKFK